MTSTRTRKWNKPRWFSRFRGNTIQVKIQRISSKLIKIDITLLFYCSICIHLVDYYIICFYLQMSWFAKRSNSFQLHTPSTSSSSSLEYLWLLVNSVVYWRVFFVLASFPALIRQSRGWEEVELGRADVWLTALCVNYCQL